MPELPLNCTNSDGIQPIYLANLYHATDYIFQSDRQAFLNLSLSTETRLLKYPDREAEYHLIYNRFYRAPQDDLRNVLNGDELFKCPGINDLLPYTTVIRRNIEACTTQCWPSALEARHQFSLHFPDLNVQNIVSTTYKFVDIAARVAELRLHIVKKFPFISMSLWRNVTEAHYCAQNCSCFEIMQLLQKTFTSDRREDRNVGQFVAERMGWTDTSGEGDVKYRWPFGFLLKKALRKERAYEYLKILSPREEKNFYLNI